ncbi:MAG: FAD-binding oxidoreductase, partial [Anaerolineae bacterium]
RYGRIEDLFAGGKLIAPVGVLEMPPFPASATGPDIRQMALGSEGRLGVLTEAVVRVFPLPETEEFHAVFFPDFEAGMTAVRHIVQARIPLSMMRLSTAVETETTLALAGHERLLAAMGRYLRLRGVGEGQCLLLFGVTGKTKLVKVARQAALALAGEQGGVHVGQTFGKQWHKNRFHSPYLRNTLWQMGYAVDTVETAVPWTAVPQTMAAMETALRQPLTAVGEKAHIFTHLSHVYPTGASIYTTVIFRLAADWGETLDRWRQMKTAVSQTIVQNGGTISHQHGVGKDHAPFLAAEKGALGMAAIDGVVERFDPEGIMNCELLIPHEIN